MSKEERTHNGLPYTIDEAGGQPAITVNGKPVPVIKDAQTGELHSTVLPYASFSSADALAKQIIENVYEYKKSG